MGQTSRMTAEVNKLIGLNLLEQGAIYLPEIGSLYTVDDNGSKRVDFSSSEQGVSLIEAIKDRAKCTAEQAAEIFRRWLEEVRTPEAVIVINGVGELRQKSFITSSYFLDKLNIKTENMNEQQTPRDEAPKPTPTPKDKKKNNKGVIIFLVILLLAVVGYFAYNAISKKMAEKAAIEAIAEKRAAEQQKIADSIAVAQIEAKKLVGDEVAAPSSALRYRLVYGVYELRSNVDVAIAKINKLYGEGAAREYPFGAYTLVSMFESNDRSECQRLLMKHYETFPDAWIYDTQR